MLSYRHAFHAGNFADVLKHSVLSIVLEYMTRKEKGLCYVDSHSGAGMYQLTDDYAQKTGEYKNGIAKVIAAFDQALSEADDNAIATTDRAMTAAFPDELVSYVELIKSLNAEHSLTVYPGSPGIAQAWLRRQDSAHLFELHPTDIDHLRDYCQYWRKAFVKQSDGYQGVMSLLPPPSKRGVVLIDPPYELKEDYVKAVQTIIDGYKKFATGTYILWYPVVKRALVEQMERQFLLSPVKNLLKIEFCRQRDTDEYGMTGSGLFVINPPWQLAAQMTTVLAFLKQTLGDADSYYCLEQLIEE